MKHLGKVPFPKPIIFNNNYYMDYMDFFRIIEEGSQKVQCYIFKNSHRFCELQIWEIF